ncbi:MAG: T9SS type A sorting domain-containing protein [Saprospiraceae bacterium]|nr:T9SS type A sorting domain-containing protein [Saprospiraceae bacterium]
MKDIFFLILLNVSTLSVVSSQTLTATLRGDGTLKVSSHGEPLNRPLSISNTHNLLPGFPLLFPADPAFKNFRNVTLDDLDNDGSDEVIIGIADQLIVLTADSILWSSLVLGLARFPAAVADLDADGIKEIILLTGFDQDPGQIYVFMADGRLKEGWPVSNDGNWMISSPALADVDGDGDLEIICSDLQGTQGSIYLYHHNGDLVEGNWPVLLPDRPAVTPSAGDLDGDGNIEIVVCTTRDIYALDQNGNLLQGWPYSQNGTRYSFQSPILVDIDHDGDLEIAGASHGENPVFYLLDHSGQSTLGWPIPVPGGSWTFHTPSIARIDDSPVVITARPIGQTPADMLYAWKPDGSRQPGFPVVQPGGHEGITTIADVDGDGFSELLYSSNLLLDGGIGQIHGAELDGSGSPDGFPIQVRGWTFLNGATLGDINGNGMLDLVILSYTEYPGATPDTAFIYAFDLGVPHTPKEYGWPTYKQNNLRNGLVSFDETTSSIRNPHFNDVVVYPNPNHGILHIENRSEKPSVKYKILDSLGRVLYSGIVSKSSSYHFSNETEGMYFLEFSDPLQGIFQVDRIIYRR